MSHFYLFLVSRGTTITWNIAGELHDVTFSMHSVIQCTNYRLTTFFRCNLPQKPYTRLRTYHSYNYTNNHIIDINKLTTSCTYLCTYFYACMPPLLTKSMWLCKRNYLIDRFMYLLCELYYHKMAQMMCLFVQKKLSVLQSIQCSHL